MASCRHTEYRGFNLETRASEGVQGFIVAFTFYSTTASIADRTTRAVDGEYKTEDAAHNAATITARKLIDLLVDDALG